ncbi:MAG: sodium-dependent transporter [Elusimicrobiota bacterium]|nr:sodium-dependent transporter [Elusimicrobiota bacterium]
MVRETWKTKLGFILASAGSAIGLGNIWRFPYLAGQHGGAAFVIVYIIAVIILGIPIMTAEYLIGRRSAKNPAGAFRALTTAHSPWVLIGFMGIFTGFIILSYYTGIAGWTLAYIVRSIFLTYWKKDAGEVFTELISSPTEPIIYLAIFMFLTGIIVFYGIQKGIERWCKILMPALFTLLILLIIRSITLPGAFDGIVFYLKPEFAKLTPKAILAAIGQAFFSLSLGMGIMITYGSYLDKKTNLLQSSIWVSSMDTLIALLAGFVIFPAVFAFGLQPSAGPGLTFVTLPQVFTKMPLGQFFGIVFFILLTIAALTSTISLLEVLSAFVIDEIGWSRKLSTILMSVLCFLLGILPALSFGILKDFTILGKGLFDSMDFLASNILLPVGGLFIAIFVSWKLDIGNLSTEIQPDKEKPQGWLLSLISVLLKFICPLLIAIILISGLEWLSLRASIIFFYCLIFISAFYLYPIIWIGRDARSRGWSASIWRFLFLLFWFLALLLYLAVRPAKTIQKEGQ